MRKFALGLLALAIIASIAVAESGITLPAASNTLKSIHFTGYPGLGIYSSSAGVMVIGDATGAGMTCTNGSGCTVARSVLTEDALQTYGIPAGTILSDVGEALTAAETIGTFDITVGTNLILVNGEVTDNETEVSVAYFQFVLPPEYVAAGDVTVRLPAALIKTGGAINNGSTLDLEVYEQTNGAVGSDLCATVAVTFAALDTYYNKDFTVTATGLVAGDVLTVKITASVIDSEGGGGTLVLNLAPPKILLDVKG